MADSSTEEPAASRRGFTSQPTSSTGTHSRTQSDQDRRSLTPSGIIKRFRPQTPKTGLRWEYVTEGCTLVSRSVHTAKADPPGTELTRRLYIDGIGYLLRGLPEDLTAEESSCLSAAAPLELRSTVQRLSRSSMDSLPGGKSRAGDRQWRKTSLLQRFVAFATFQMVLFLAFLLPYIQALCRFAYRYDRKHKISDRILSTGAVVTTSSWEQVIETICNLDEMHDGTVGQALKGIGIWWIQGVSAGILEGLEAGLRADGPKADANNADAQEGAYENEGSTEQSDEEAR